MFRITEKELHSHLKKRMQERGVTIEEIQITLNHGKNAEDAKSGTAGKKHVFNFNEYWEGQYFKEKEVTVYYKKVQKKVILLTALARYGEDFE